MRPLFFCSLLLVTLSNCRNQPQKELDYAALLKQLDADPEVVKVRKLALEHSLLVASFDPQELNALREKARSCGIEGESISPDQKDCMKALPGGERYVSMVVSRKEYGDAKKAVENQYPVLKSMSIERRNRLLVFGSEAATLDSFPQVKRAAAGDGYDTLWVR
ncbi:MAG: hypothetical protein R2791_13500 [Saprospiraceae bacterium]